MIYNVLWVPSQNVGEALCLHWHIYLVPLASAVNITGVNSDPLCDPSQNGWFFDSPHEHHAYFLPSSNSTGTGCFAAIVGLDIVLFHF